jgi:D-alanine--poly(phosphoribitol) ligase subunit 1
MYQYNLGVKFEETVEMNGSNNAILFETVSVNYNQLNQMVNRIAHLLLEKGVCKSDVVALSSEKNLTTFSAILACLKIGAIYCVFDRKSPKKRLKRIFSNCGPKYIVANKSLVVSTHDESTVILDLHGNMKDEIQKMPVTPPKGLKMIHSGHPAYIMYTSGSTGDPKGVTITHGNVINLINWSVDEYGFGPGERLTNVNPLFFDNSVFDFYSSLFTGACIVPFSRKDLKNPVKLLQEIENKKCTSWFSVPSFLIYMQTMKILKSDSIPHIKRFIFGGEGYVKTKLVQLFNMYGERARIYNVYGPTECTCICSSYEVSENDFEDVNGLPPLGNMANNFDFIVVDSNNNPVAIDETGELLLMGDNVGLGYFNDEVRSLKSFVQNPLNSKFRQIAYRTGDLVRLCSEDDKMYFEGRVDHQIKHMGYRIELGEIESALYRSKDVDEAVVVYAEHANVKKIIGFFVSSKRLSVAEVRDHIKEHVPIYMIPQLLIQLNTIPKNSNGKIDRVLLTNEIFLKNNK